MYAWDHVCIGMQKRSNLEKKPPDSANVRIVIYYCHINTIFLTF